jgi:hypothetical protein
MSVSTAPLTAWPAGQNGVTAMQASSYQWGAWSEVIPTTPTFITLVGLTVFGDVGLLDGASDIEVGIGAAGTETIVSRFRGRFWNDRPSRTLWAEIPIAVIPVGSRVSVRTRSLSTTSAFRSLDIALVGYAQYLTDTDHQTSSPLTALPADAVVSVTPNATAWGDSSWVEMTPGEAVPLGVHAFTTRSQPNAAAVDWEVDLGIGPAGAEQVVTTKRMGSVYASGAFVGWCQFGGPYLVPADTRIALRLRKGDTNTTSWLDWGLSVYYGLAGPPPPPTEYEPDPDVDVSGETIGLTWVEHRTKDDVLHVSSKVPLPDPFDYYGGWKEPDIIEWGTIRRALSDWRRRYEGTSFRWRHSDAPNGTDHPARFWRTLLAADETKIMLNDSVVIRMCGDAARRALELARTIVRGVIRKYKPVSPLAFEFQAEDWLTQYLTKEIPNRRAILDFANTPEGNQQLPIPIIYGDESDRTFETRSVPSVLPFGSDIPPCHVFCHDAIGGTMSGRVWAMVCAVIDGEEGPHSNMAGTYVSAPSTRSLVVFWDEVAGADSYNIYIFNGSPWPNLRGNLNGSTVIRVKTHDTATHDGTWHSIQVADYKVTFTGWDDGDDALAEHTEVIDIGHGVVKPVYTGQVTLGGVAYHQFVLAAHACKAILDLYIDGVPQRIYADATQAGSGGIWLVPGYAGWTAIKGANSYEDINGRRYCIIYGKVGYYGPDRGAGISTDDPGTEEVTDTTGLTVNVWGIEDVGDGSGTLITKGILQYEHFLNNWAFGEYASGAWLEAPLFPTDPPPEDEDVLHMVDHDSFVAADAASDLRIAGGYVNACAMTTIKKLEDRIAEWNTSCDVDSGCSRKTQYAVWMEQASAEILAAARLYTQERDIFERTFDIEDADSEFFNDRPYMYQHRPADDSWAQIVAPGANIHAQSIADAEETRTADSMKLYMVRSGGVAIDIGSRALARSAYPPRYVKWKTGLGGLNDELGSIVRCRHTDGIGSGGWVNHPLRIHVHEFDPEANTVMLRLRDMHYLFSGYM